MFSYLHCLIFLFLAMESNRAAASEEAVINKIMLIRDEKVILDMDLAELYGVTTQTLHEQVKCNLTCFPPDFMFQLTHEEKSEMIAIGDYLSKLNLSSELPYAFTEYGVLMLASILDSKQAIAVNIQIIRVFVRMRGLLMLDKQLLIRLEELENVAAGQDEQVERIYRYIRDFLKE